MSFRLSSNRLPRFDAVGLRGAAENRFAAARIAAPRLENDGGGHKRRESLRRVFAQDALRDLLMQHFGEIIGHIVARHVAYGAEPCVGAALPPPACVMRIKASAEGVQEVGIAVKPGIGAARGERLFQRPARVGIAVPAHGVTAFVRVAEGAPALIRG